MPPAPLTEPGFPETPYGIVKRLRVIEEWLAPEGRSLRILDFGCGTGEQITWPLARAGHHVLGLDLHPPSIEQAKSRYQMDNLEFRVATIDDLRNESGLFDAIICSEVLEHLHEPQLLLAALRPLLVPGGSMVVTTPNGTGSYELLCALERTLARNSIYQKLRQMNRTADGSMHAEAGFLNFESGHVQFFRLAALEALFSAAGLRLVDTRARTFLCGPYVDLLFRWIPFRRFFIQVNANIADALPVRCAADWMFLLKNT